MKTDFENVFFTMTKEGAVTFYEVNGGSITAIPETGSFEVTAECSSQKLPAVIHYIERDGKTNGYGLFTNILYPDVLLYDYAFFKVTDMFNAFADKKGTLLMMLDINYERFYSDEKIYSEIFYLYADHTSEHFLSENQRTIDIYARMKSDYKMFTDDILAQSSDSNVLFFSSRNYVSFDESNQVDIFTSGGSGNNVDNVVYIEDIDTLHFWRDGKDTYYFAKTDEEDSFVLKKHSGNDSESIASFSGDPDEDYIIKGSFILSRLTGDIYNVLTKNKVTLPYDKFTSNFTPDMFTISENGRFCAVRGSDSGKAIAGIVDFETGEVTVCVDDVFGFVANMQVLNDGTVIISTANGESATAFYQLTAKLGASAGAQTPAEGTEEQ